MNSKTDEKINQVSEKTLVIGIAKRTHFACAVDDRGRVLQKSFAFTQSRNGFEMLYTRIIALKEGHLKQEVIVGFEPTGHYWMNLAAFLTDHGIPYVMARIEIATLLTQYRLLQSQLETLTDELIELAHQTPDYEYLSSVPGIGDVTIIELLSEIGSFKQYKDPRQLIKLAGLTLRENSSGQQKGQKRISKRGRRRLRHHKLRRDPMCIE